jgi:2,3-dimethylmalate lyase
MDSALALREVLAAGGEIVPAVCDPLTAKLAEKAGLNAVYLSLDALAASFGLAHAGSVTMTELAEEAQRVATSVDIPVLCDVGSGFGNYLNARRTTRACARAGVAGVVVTDEYFPATSLGREPIPTDEMIGKITSVLEGRDDGRGPLVIAGVGVRSAAITAPVAEARARSYEDAGVDAILLGTCCNASLDELAVFVGQRSIPTMIVASELAEVPRSSGAVRRVGSTTTAIDTRVQSVGASGIHDLLMHVQQVGTVTDRLDRMVTTAFVTDLLGLPKLRELEETYLPDPGTAWTPW